MKIRVVSSRDEITTLAPIERIVHLTFRPSNKDIFRLLEACPKLQVIQLPTSYMASIADSVITLLDLQRVQLIEGEVQGHRKDFNDYYEVPTYVIDNIFTLKAENKSSDEIVDVISARHRYHPAMVRVLLKETCC